MTTPKATPFRAGRQLNEHPLDLDVLPEAMPPDFGVSVTLLADVSEFQPQVADAAYVAWSPAIVIRAMYGDAHDDQAWYNGQRREFLHTAGIKFLGIYQYIVAGQDAAAQARALAQLIGKMEPGEKIIYDLEEGSGNQAARRDAWKSVIQGELGDSPWGYSGEYFENSHGITPVEWVAAYGTIEPAERHQLWQFTDNFTVPGVGACDCSVFHGTPDELAALAWQPKPAGWTFPAPAHLTVAKQTRSGYTLTWQPVTGPGNQIPASYSVYTFDNSGSLVNHQNTVPGTWAAEYGPAGRGLPAGIYHTNVWANGAPQSPAHSSVTATLTH